MAIEVPKEKKKNNWLWLAVLILLLIIGYFGWKVFIPSNKLLKSPDISELLGPTTEQIQKLELDINSVINNPVFQTLKSYLTAPLTSGAVGRLNPFIPF